MRSYKIVSNIYIYEFLLVIWAFCVKPNLSKWQTGSRHNSKLCLSDCTAHHQQASFSPGSRHWRDLRWGSLTLAESGLWRHSSVHHVENSGCTVSDNCQAQMKISRLQSVFERFFPTSSILADFPSYCWRYRLWNSCGIVKNRIFRQSSVTMRSAEMRWDATRGWKINTMQHFVFSSMFSGLQ